VECNGKLRRFYKTNPKVQLVKNKGKKRSKKQTSSTELQINFVVRFAIQFFIYYLLLLIYTILIKIDYSNHFATKKNLHLIGYTQQ
jgi:hypothetical protein